MLIPGYYRLALSSLLWFLLCSLSPSVLTDVLTDKLTDVSPESSWEPSPQNLSKLPKFIYASSDQAVISLIDSDGKEYRPIQRLTVAMFHKAGVEWQNLPLPLLRLYHYLYNGRANFSVLIKLKELDKCCIMSEQSVYSVDFGVYQKAHKPKIETLTDLSGKKVIALLKYSFGRLNPYLTDPKNKIVIYGVHTHEIAFAMLQAGRADYFIDYLGPAQTVLEEKKKYDLEYNVLNRLDLHIVLKKDYPNAKEVAEYLATVFNSLNDAKMAE